MKKHTMAVLFFMIGIFPVAAQSPLNEGIGFVDAGRIAVAASQDLQNQYALLDIKQHAWLAGIRAYLPTLSLSAFENDRLAEYGADSFQKNYSLSIEQLLFDGGKLLTSRRIEKSKIAQRVAELEAESGDIFESAISSYRNILAERELLAIKERGLASLEEERGIIAAQLDLGMILASDLAKADVNISEAKVDILSTLLELKELESQFAELLGLDELPPLTEKIDAGRDLVLPDIDITRSTAQLNSPELKSATLSIKEKEEEAKFAARTWIPSLSANGSFSLAGDKYPLTQYTWSVGLSIKFDMPWLKSDISGAYGYEGRYTQNARIQGSGTIAPDPASAVTMREADVTLSQERAHYTQLFERAGRNAVLLLEKCRLGDEKRKIALQTADLARERLALSKISFELGEITALQLLDIHTDLTEKEIEAMQAAIAVREAERQLEKALNLQPGELENFSKNKRWRYNQ